MMDVVGSKPPGQPAVELVSGVAELEDPASLTKATPDPPDAEDGVVVVDEESDTAESATDGFTDESEDSDVSKPENDEPVPEPIVTPLDVVQIARQWEEDRLEVSFAVLLDDDQETVTPNGLIVAQQIPEGWEVIEADPQAEAFDEADRVVKWLFVGDAVCDNSIYSLSMRAPEEEAGEWSDTLAWYTYRQPDGECVDVHVTPYTESDIQPGL